MGDVSLTLYAKIDVAIARDPRMIAAGPMARLLYIQAFAYCRENLTDGLIDRLLLPIIAVDIKSPALLMSKLVKVGALEETCDGWRIPLRVWRKYNPMRADVEAMVVDKRAAGVLGNHNRWHGERSDPKCPHCHPERLALRIAP